jgi:hypothetical protein
VAQGSHAQAGIVEAVGVARRYAQHKAAASGAQHLVVVTVEHRLLVVSGVGLAQGAGALMQKLQHRGVGQRARPGRAGLAGQAVVRLVGIGCQLQHHYHEVAVEAERRGAEAAAVFAAAGHYFLEYPVGGLAHQLVPVLLFHAVVVLRVQVVHVVARVEVVGFEGGGQGFDAGKLGR